jgi:hypothetical protein
VPELRAVPGKVAEDPADVLRRDDGAFPHAARQKAAPSATTYAEHDARSVSWKIFRSDALDEWPRVLIVAFVTWCSSVRIASPVEGWVVPRRRCGLQRG